MLSMKKNYSYSSDFKAPFSKKFASDAIDLVLIFILSTLLAFVGYFSFTNTSYYHNQVSYVNEQVDAINDLAIDAKLASLDEEGNLEDNVTLFNDYLDSHILLSYSLNSSAFNEKGIDQTIIDEHIKNISAASYENDSLGFFYVHYLDEFNGKTTVDEKKIEFVNLLSEQDNAKELYNLEEDFPSLKVEIAIEAFNYLYLSSATSEVYEQLGNIFINVLNNSISMFQTLPEVIALYDEYDLAYASILDIINIILTIAFVISFLLIYLLPSFFMQDAQSIGKRVNKVIIANKEDKKVKVSNLIIRHILTFINYFFIVFFVAFFISGVQSLMYASFPFFIFPLISFILCLINVTFALFSKNVNSLTDIVSGSIYLLAREIKE